MHDTEHIFEILKQFIQAKRDAVKGLRRIGREAVAIADLLEGKAPQEPRSSTNKVTNDDVRNAVDTAKAQHPGIHGQELRTKTKEVLKANGKSLSGVSRRLDQVLGEPPKPNPVTPPALPQPE